MSNAPDEPTEAERALLYAIYEAPRMSIEVGLLRAHVAAEVAKATAELLKDKERLDWLERFLQLGGASVFTTCTGQAVKRRDDDTDETHFNHPFCIGYEVEQEHRGCYRWQELSNGAKGIRPAIDAARAQQKDT